MSVTLEDMYWILRTPIHMEMVFYDQEGGYVEGLHQIFDY